MSELGTAFVRIRPNTTGFKGEAEREVRHGLSGIGKIIGGSFAAVGIEEGVKKVAEAAAKQQEELSVVRQAIKSTNAAWRVHGHTVAETLREQAVKFGFTVSNLAQGFTRIQVSTKDTKKSMTLLDAAMDIARARHLGLAQAAVVVAKASAGNVTGLQRLGIVIPKVTSTYDALKKKYDDAVASGAKFTKEQKLSIKESLDAAKARDKEATKMRVLLEIQERFGGQAANFAKTAEGSSERFHEAVNELEVSIGNGLLPTLTSAATGATKLFKELADGGQVQAFAASTAEELASAYRVFKGIASALAPPIGAIAKALGDVAHATGGGGIVAFVIGYKSLAIATGIAERVQAKYAKTLKASQGAAAQDAQAETARTAATTEGIAATAASTASVEEQAVAFSRSVDAMLAAEAETVRLAEAQTALAAKYRITSVAVNGSGFMVANAGGRFVTTTGKVAAFGKVAESSASKISLLGRGLFTLAGGWTTLAAVGLGAAAYGIYKLVTAESDWDRANRRVASSLAELDRESQRALELRKQITFLTNQIPSDKISVAQAKLNEQNAIAALYASKADKSSREFKQLQLDVAQAIQSRKDAQRQLNSDQDDLDKKQRNQASNNRQYEKSIRDGTQALLDRGRTAQKAAREQVDALRRSGPRGGGAGRASDAEARINETAAKRFADKTLEEAKTEKNKTIRRNEELVATYALQYKKIPSAKIIRFILKNDDAKATLGSILFQIDTTAVKAKAKGRHVGTSLVDGVTAGIVQNEGSIAKTLVSSLTKAQEAAKKAIGAHSPSTKTRDEIGKPIMDGIVAGIQSVDADAVLAEQVSLRKTRARIRQEIKKLVPDDTHAVGNVATKRGRPYLRQYGHDPRVSPHSTEESLEKFVGRGTSRAGVIAASRWIEENRKALLAVDKLYKRDSKAAATMRANSRLVAHAFADGIRAGIAERVSAVNDAFAHLLGGTVDTVKRSISASKARDEIGKPLIQGVADGIRSVDADAVLADQLTLKKTRAKIRSEIKKLIPDEEEAALGNIRTRSGRASLRQSEGVRDKSVTSRTTADDLAPQIGRGISAGGTIEALRWVEQHRKALLAVEALYKRDARAAAKMRSNARLIAHAFGDGIREGVADRSKSVHEEFDRLFDVAAKKKTFVLPKPNRGLVEEGNIDLLNRKVAKLKDAIATVHSFSIATSKGETLLPQVIDGKLVSLKRAIAEFRRTGRNLGTFDTAGHADDYAERLHREQAMVYASVGTHVAKTRSSARVVGRAFGDGVAAGVHDRVKQVNDAFAGLLGGGVEAARKKIGAHSPSEVARTQIGHSISDGIRLGVLDKNGEVIKSVTDQVTDAINAGTAAVRDAVNSAKQNLNSIGSSVAGDVSTLLDKINKTKQSVGFKVSGPVAEALKALQVEIAKGKASPELVRKAQSLQNQLAAQSQRAASKPVAKNDPEAITRKIADATDLLNKGAITLEVFNKRVHRVLKDAGATPARAKKELGVAFADQFKADLHGLVEQAKALLASPRIKGTGLEPQIVRPLETIRDQQRSIADAAASQRQQQLDEARQHTALLKKANKHAADIAAHTKGAATAAEIAAYIRAAKKSPSAAAKSVIGAHDKHGGG